MKKMKIRDLIFLSVMAFGHVAFAEKILNKNTKDNINQINSSSEAYDSNLLGYKINAVFEDETTSVMYAGSDQGLFISQDQGQTWALKTTANGLKSNEIKDIAANGNNIFIIDSGNADVSYDGGNKFKPLHTKYTKFYKDVEYAHDTVYLLANSDEVDDNVDDNAFLVESTDQGKSWKNFSWPTNVFSIVNPEHLFVNEHYMGFVDTYLSTAWLSTDGGYSWKFIIPRDASFNVPILYGIYADGKQATLSTNEGVGETLITSSIWDQNDFDFVTYGLGSHIVKKTFVDNSDKIFAVTDKGLGVATQYLSGTSRYANHIEGSGSQLPSSVINDVYANSNLIFVGTDNGVAYYSNNKNFSWQEVQNEMGDDVTSVSGTNMGLYFSGYGQIFTCNSSAGCDLNGDGVIDLPYKGQVNKGHGLTSYDFSFGIFQAIINTGTPNEISSNYVTSTYSDQNNLYIGSIAGLDISKDSGKTWQYKRLDRYYKVSI